MRIDCGIREISQDSGRNRMLTTEDVQGHPSLPPGGVIDTEPCKRYGHGEEGEKDCNVGPAKDLSVTNEDDLIESFYLQVP